jgi:prephenate dehydratase
MELMVFPGETIDTVKQVISHPIALNQCSLFLAKYPLWKITEADDTASSAKLISQKKIKGVAAIASNFAAKTYGLNIIASSIESNKKIIQDF